jgi:parvulin-like peptidyl-prolyl isomerase
MKKIIMFAAAAVFIVSAAVVLLLRLNVLNFNDNSRTAVAEIDGEKVYLSDFYYYLIEQMKMFESTGGADIWDTDFGGGESADNLAKQNALNDIITVKVAVKQAQRQGVALDEAETAESAERARSMYDELSAEYNLSADMDLPSLTEIVRQTDIYTKLFAKVTENYEVSNSDFERYFSVYYGENRKSLEDITVQYLLCVKGERAAENAALIQMLASQGRPMDEILPMLLGAAGIENIKYGRAMANESLIHPEAVEIAYELPVGVVSDIIPTSDGGYYVLEVLDISLPDINGLRDKVMQIYIDEKKTEVFDREYARWAENVNIVRNQNILSEVSVFDLSDKPQE